MIKGVVVLGLEVVEGCLLAGNFCLSISKVVVSLVEFSVCCIKLSLESITL